MEFIGLGNFGVVASYEVVGFGLAQAPPSDRGASPNWRGSSLPHPISCSVCGKQNGRALILTLHWDSAGEGAAFRKLTNK